MPKYNSIENIPAKVFFDILKTKDFQQLKPRPREKDLDKVFMQIYDDYFIKAENDQAAEFMRLQNIVIVNRYKINILKQSLAYYFFSRTTKEMRQKFIASVKIGYGIEIDENLPFEDEVQRILDFDIAYMENDIALAEIDMKNMKSSFKTDGIDFYDRMIELSNDLVGNTLINEKMTLAVFVALEKSARKQKEKLN